MGILGFFQRLFSGEGIVKAVREFEEPIESFGDFVSSFFAGIEEEEREIIAEREKEPTVEEVPELREDEYRRKIVKTGKSKEGNRNVFALTFESNNFNRELKLVQAIEQEFGFSPERSTYGYEDFITTNRPPFIWPKIRTGKE